jgi:hypothetical protein
MPTFAKLKTLNFNQMNKKLWIALGVVALLIFWGVGARNGMATSDQEVKASWANVQSAYQRRADLIPNLVKTVQGVANFEKINVNRCHRSAGQCHANEIRFERFKS